MTDSTSHQQSEDHLRRPQVNPEDHPAQHPANGSVQQHRLDLNTLYYISLDLLNRRDPEDVMQSLMQQVKLLVDVDHVNVDLVEGEELVTYTATAGQPLEKGDRVRRGETAFLSWQAVETGQPAIVDDYATWPRRRFDDPSLHADAEIPLKRDNKVIGVLSITRTRPDYPFSAADIDTALRLASLAALILDNAQRYAKAQREIEDRKQTELALRQSTEELITANAQLQAFSAMVAHDLRNPLTSIVQYIEWLHTHYPKRVRGGEARQVLQWLDEAAQRMGQLIQDMLDFSRVTEGALVCRPVDLSALAQNQLLELRRREPKRSVETVIRPDLITEGDERFLQILLDNLLGNAWKFTGQLPQARIEVGAVDRDEGQAFYVRDNGVGFDMTRAAPLFQPFQRLHQDIPGTGLGLAACRRIVARHGGRIWVESKSGQGTTVYFTITPVV